MSLHALDELVAHCRQPAADALHRAAADAIEELAERLAAASLGAGDRRHLAVLLRDTAAGNRRLAHAAQRLGDERGAAYHLGTSAAYRRVAKRLEQLEAGGLCG